MTGYGGEWTDHHLWKTVHVHILFFTQTGNTLAVAEAMGEAAETRGTPATLYPTKLFSPDEIRPERGDVLVVGSPVFFGRAPLPVRRYLDELPNLSGVRAAAFVTSGGASGRALSDILRGLRSQEALVLADAVFGGAVSGAFPPLAGAQAQRPDREDLDRAHALMTTLLDSADRRPGRPGAGRRTISLYGPTGLVLDRQLLRQQMLAEPRVDRETCTTCGWCVQHCPTNAITFPAAGPDTPRALDGARREPPTVTGECIRCYRCLSCPVGAVGAPSTIGRRALGLLYHPALVERCGDGPPVF